MNQSDIIAILKKRNTLIEKSICGDTYGLSELYYKSVSKEILEKVNTEKQFAKGFEAGMKSVRRKNKSGCCCTFSDDDTKIIQLCGEHENYYEERIEEEKEDES